MTNQINNGHAVSFIIESLPDQFLCVDFHAFPDELGA